MLWCKIWGGGFVQCVKGITDLMTHQASTVSAAHSSLYLYLLMRKQEILVHHRSIPQEVDSHPVERSSY